MSNKPRYRLTLEANDDRTDIDGVRRLRLTLKRLLRNYGLRCVALAPQYEPSEDDKVFVQALIADGAESSP